HLDEGEPASAFAEPLPDGLDLLTRKPMIYVANVDEGGDAAAVAALEAYAAGRGAEVVAVAARFEAELAELDDQEEREAFLRELGLDEPGMPRLARACYRALGLISFFTAGPMEARAWTVREGATAVEAAGKIHSDIARGFIRAEVIGWRDLVACGSHEEAKKRGLLRGVPIHQPGHHERAPDEERDRAEGRHGRARRREAQRDPAAEQQRRRADPEGELQHELEADHADVAADVVVHVAAQERHDGVA